MTGKRKGYATQEGQAEANKRYSFRAVLFRMVPKRNLTNNRLDSGFRAVLFRMVPKHNLPMVLSCDCFRAVLFRMVPKL